MTITYPEMIDAEYYIVLYIVKHIFSLSDTLFFFCYVFHANVRDLRRDIIEATLLEEQNLHSRFWDSLILRPSMASALESSNRNGRCELRTSSTPYRIKAIRKRS